MAENNRGLLSGDSNLSFFTLTPALTIETPCLSVFQAESEGVRVEKENTFLLKYSVK